MRIPELQTRPVTLADTSILHRLYQQSERYFKIIAAPIPLEVDVRSELESALSDPRRHLEFLLAADPLHDDPPHDDPPHDDPLHDDPLHNDPLHDVVGYLDLKFNYPNHGDATINLLLIAEPFQSDGWGSSTVQDLEARLQSGRIEHAPTVHRLLAGIYAENPGAMRFWERHGYHFAIDARPVLAWYEKILTAPTPESDKELHVSR
jgi:ribosomal protein S18 acetylase RimI-like enzyme